jgi:hypothetical protein
MGTDSQVPLTQRLEHLHLLDVVRVEMLQLEPVLVEDHSDEPPGRDGEAALVEGHERDDIPLGRSGTDSSPGTFHSTVSVSEAAQLRRGSAASSGSHWSTFSSTWRWQAFVRDSGESGGGAAGAKSKRSGRQGHRKKAGE